MSCTCALLHLSRATTRSSCWSIVQSRRIDQPILAAGFKRSGTATMQYTASSWLSWDLISVHRGCSRSSRCGAGRHLQRRPAELFPQQARVCQVAPKVSRSCSRGFGLRKVTGNDIRIDDRDTEVILEDIGDGRFATADTACQAYD